MAYSIIMSTGEDIPPLYFYLRAIYNLSVIRLPSFTTFFTGEMSCPEKELSHSRFNRITFFINRP